MRILDDRFDLLELRAARTLGEADYYWRRHLKRVPATRPDIAPLGFLPKVRRIIDAVLLKDGLR